LLSGINEKRSCGNTANTDQESCHEFCISVYLNDYEYGDQNDVQGYLARDQADEKNTQCVCCAPKILGCPGLPLLTDSSVPAADFTDFFIQQRYTVEVVKKPSPGFIVHCHCPTSSLKYCKLVLAVSVVDSPTYEFTRQNIISGPTVTSSTLITCTSEGYYSVGGGNVVPNSIWNTGGIFVQVGCYTTSNNTAG